MARAEGWPVPVFEHKRQTDANYERCTRLLHDHHGDVRAAFASHNLRSLGYAIAYGRSKGIPDDGYEVQMLYGMAEPLHRAVARDGPARCGCTPRWASWCRAWRTSCGGCWRTPPTRASCATASPRGAPSTRCWRRPTSSACPTARGPAHRRPPIPAAPRRVRARAAGRVAAGDGAGHVRRGRAAGGRRTGCCCGCRR